MRKGRCSCTWVEWLGSNEEDIEIVHTDTYISSQHLRFKMGLERALMNYYWISSHMSLLTKHMVIHTRGM